MQQRQFIAKIEKAKLAAELFVTKKELVLIKEKAKLTDELVIANKELADKNSEYKKLAEDLKHNVLQLEYSNSNMIGRELKMIELKKEINALLLQLGKEKKYSNH